MKEKILLLELWQDRLIGVTELVEDYGLPYKIVRPYKQEPIEYTKYSGIIISGGTPSILEIDKYPFLNEVVSFVKYAVNQSIPILGICLGNQILAYAIGGKVSRQQKPEIGFHNIYHNGTDLLKGIPNPFLAFEYHFDEVVELPKNTTILATGEGSKIQAFRVKDKPFWGVQFHPEINRNLGIHILSDRKEVIEGIGLNADEMIDLGKKKYFEEYSSMVLKNYLNFIKETTDEKSLWKKFARNFKEKVKDS